MYVLGAFCTLWYTVQWFAVAALGRLHAAAGRAARRLSVPGALLAVRLHCRRCGRRRALNRAVHGATRVVVIVVVETVVQIVIKALLVQQVKVVFWVKHLQHVLVKPRLTAWVAVEKLAGVIWHWRAHAGKHLVTQEVVVAELALVKVTILEVAIVVCKHAKRVVERALCGVSAGVGGVHRALLPPRHLAHVPEPAGVHQSDTRALTQRVYCQVQL
mmetsp:Transcript_14971/g.44066  ORF Transcript_14971/g.44066 Transcript_14971/m.44066 type:complete len:216 (+) Transcript_14971:391-1038(+)